MYKLSQFSSNPGQPSLLRVFLEEVSTGSLGTGPAREHYALPTPRSVL